jgi:hypothetical protein
VNIMILFVTVFQQLSGPLRSDAQINPKCQHDQQRRTQRSASFTAMQARASAQHDLPSITNLAFNAIDGARARN